MPTDWFILDSSYRWRSNGKHFLGHLEDNWTISGIGNKTEKMCTSCVQYLNIPHTQLPVDIISNDEVSQNAISGDPGLLNNTGIECNFSQGFGMSNYSRRRRRNITCWDQITILQGFPIVLRMSKQNTHGIAMESGQQA